MEDAGECGHSEWIVAVTSALTADKLRARQEADTQPTERARDKAQGKQAYVRVSKSQRHRSWSKRKPERRYVAGKAVSQSAMGVLELKKMQVAQKPLICCLGKTSNCPLCYFTFSRPRGLRTNRHR
jgi:hypothetical protein